ncbi:MAG: hypothetical protein IPK26_00625 [Planctomycetes bacterium]|nr:hypothetical protein [Planctomycetota bacterium]
MDRQEHDLRQRLPDRRDTQALFVGQPGGGRPNHFGDAQRRTLTVSGALLAVSTPRWQDLAAEDRRAFLAPDLPAPLRYADRVAGRDPGPLAIASFQAGGRQDDGPRWRRASQAAVPKAK